MAKDFTVLRADLRGHGKSPYVPTSKLEDYADDVHALLVKLNFAPCAVAGFAMGVGARTAGGCTSGHGLTGMSLGSPASIVAAMTFFGTAVALAHVWAWLAGAAS